ncbi:carboxymuconolactone decarboxylase family protein [Salinibacter altiplanensis]|uniref:carboxymuconolactone decarboxylase family protein n=1 Tax=Salinibacter altiplanensis TaxID=1803181 RepID=UPI000C9F5A68|nr:carboxymuconolactone decarboxylase family protein [Salinibacter altiplanensis]
MSHIDLPDAPGFFGLMQRFPKTAQPLTQLAESLLRGSSPLSPGERELIAAHVSAQNGCQFCEGTHGATARHLFAGNPNRDSETVARVLEEGPNATDVGDKLAALLRLATETEAGGEAVTDEIVEEARAAGAGDETIHDTVLIAAAFGMFNRYIDGLGAPVPSDLEVYDEHGAFLAENGYQQPSA